MPFPATVIPRHAPFICQSCRSIASEAPRHKTDILFSITPDRSEVSRLLALVEDRNNWAGMRAERTDLLEKVQSDTLWQDDADKAIAYQKRLSQLEDALNEYDSYLTKHNEITDLLELAQEEQDPALCDDITADLHSLREQLERFSLRLMMSEEADRNGCFLELRAGAGGAEACDWVSILARMYERWGVSQSHDVKVVDDVKGEVAGLKSATLQISGEYAYGWCKHEAGVHRFVRMSPFDANNKRHTSFVSVQVYPAFESDGASDVRRIEIPPGDIKIDVMRAQGAGGQHVNTTESAVRIVHLPTGIMVTCQSQRSQHQNKAVAIQMLQAKLYERELRAKMQAKADQRADLADNAWGSQIRSYVLHPYKMIKDVRTGYERGDVDKVLDGDLNAFMEAALLHFGRKSMG
ncbi:hypothetical protein SpCBS45565_g08254 [Spizellomyces sp. 'palustris']|nr:hypothetical protein SpCBS45565_g08254 [Spizellomyces sp. 'palustris']